MATSGTVGQTAFDTIDLIELAYARCGIKASMITGELIDKAKRSLSLLLVRLPSITKLLWTQEKVLYGLMANTPLVNLKAGSLNVASVQVRTVTYPTGGIATASTGTAANAFDKNTATLCTQTAPNGFIAYQFVAPTTVTTIGFLPGATAPLAPVYEYSVDGIVWNLCYTLSTLTVITDNVWVWNDISSPPTAKYFRIRETGGNTLVVREVCFGSAPNDNDLTPMNQDDYDNLPNKYEATRPYQYWFKRNITPALVLWPLNNNSFDILCVRQTRQIQDVGDLTNNIEMPIRWYDALVWNLAQQIGNDIPEIAVPDSRMQIIISQAGGSLLLVTDEERDAMPSTFMPDYTAYTR